MCFFYVFFHSALISLISGIVFQGFDFEAVMNDLRKLKIIAKGHERRILTLEKRLARYEGGAQT